jgi:hypothetical protein
MQPITPSFAKFLLEGNIIFDVWTGCSNPRAEMERDLDNYNKWQQVLKNKNADFVVDDAAAGR